MAILNEALEREREQRDLERLKSVNDALSNFAEDWVNYANFTLQQGRNHFRTSKGDKKVLEAVNSMWREKGANHAVTLAAHSDECQPCKALVLTAERDFLRALMLNQKTELLIDVALLGVDMHLRNPSLNTHIPFWRRLLAS